VGDGTLLINRSEKDNEHEVKIKVFHHLSLDCNENRLKGEVF